MSIERLPVCVKIKDTLNRFYYGIHMKSSKQIRAYLNLIVNWKSLMHHVKFHRLVPFHADAGDDERGSSESIADSKDFTMMMCSVFWKSLMDDSK